MRLDAHVAVNRGAFTLDLPLVVEPGEVVALVGSNGAGKSTFLHAIAGLVELDAGHVRLGGRVLDDVGAGIHVPAEARRCGLVFQDHLVFPHLTALENVAFGLRATGVQRAQAHACAYEWLKRLGMAGQAGLSGSRLSGGQAQRVALARALAVEPDVLLLDEPFAALDEHSHRGVRDMLRTLVITHARPVIIVIHDPTDARCVADRVVPLAGGRLRSRSGQRRTRPATPRAG